MANHSKNCKSTVIPGMRYRDCLAAITWLCTALGFEKHAVYMGKENSVQHAELTFGNGMIMIGSVENGTQSSTLLKQPGEIGGAETQTPCLIVSDCDVLYASAKAAGARILIELEEKGYGGKSFTCSDPEGHIWHIGTYDPWQPQAE